MIPAGPQPQRISEDIPDRMPERMSEDMPETYARKNVLRYGIYQVALLLKLNARQNARKNVRRYARDMPERMS